MAIYKKLRRWHRWHGSVADVAAISRKAAELVPSDSSRGQDDSASITVALPALETTFESANEFEQEIVLGDVPRIETIRVGVQPPEQDVSAVITFSRTAPAVSLDVVGHDRKEVEGISGLLRDELNRGRRVGEALFRWTPIGVGTLVLIAWLVVIVAWDGAPWWLAALGGLLTLFYVIPSAILNRLVPVLELKTAGTPTKWERSRKWLMRTAYAGLALAATTVVSVIVTAVVS